MPFRIRIHEKARKQPRAFRLKPTTRFDLFQPELIGCFAMINYKVFLYACYAHLLWV